jgi:hypothetical protein
MRKSVKQAPTAGEQTQQKPCRMSSDIGTTRKSYCRTRSDVGSERVKGLKDILKKWIGLQFVWYERHLTFTKFLVLLVF